MGYRLGYNRTETPSKTLNIYTWNYIRYISTVVIGQVLMERRCSGSRCQNSDVGCKHFDLRLVSFCVFPFGIGFIMAKWLWTGIWISLYIWMDLNNILNTLGFSLIDILAHLGSCLALSWFAYY